MAFDFSHLEAAPAQTGRIDFSSLGAIPAVGGGADEEDSTSMLGAAGRGAVGMIPLGEQAYAGIESLVDNTPYIKERQELEKDIEADKANHPGARLAGQAAGVIAPAIMTGGASIPGGVAAEGALVGAGFGAGKAIDTLAGGGSGTEAAGDVALGAVTGAAGGAAGKSLGNVITKVAKPFVNSQDELLAEATAGILGGTTRQIRSLPGKNPVETLMKLGKDMSRYKVNGEPLVAVTDQMPDRLNKFLALQKQAGETIGNTIRTANVPPMSVQPITEELNAALKFATPDDQAQMAAVISQVQKYAEKDGTIPFDRVQLLKGELGDRAFEGQGNPVLQSAYHVVSDVQDRELEKVASTINKPEFDAAKNAYQMTSRAIPMLRMAVSKEIGGKTNLLVPGAALISGHPLVAVGALAKNRLAQMGSGAMFKGIQALPENAGAFLENIPGKMAGQVAGASVQQNMGETTPLPGQGAPSPSQKAPNSLNIDHPAMAQWRPMFQKNAMSAKNPGELEKSHAVTDFILSQRDPAYAAAKQKMADEPMPEGAVAPQSVKMAEGGVIEDPNKAFAANREAIEPGIMGETEPAEQKFLGALNALGEGYGMGQLGGAALKTGMSVAKAAPRILGNEAGAIFPHPLHFNAVPAEVAQSAQDIMPAVKTGTGKVRIGGPRDMHGDIMANVTGKDSNGMTEGFYDNLTGKFLDRNTASEYVGGKGPLMAEELIKLKQGGLKLFDPAKPPTGENLTAMKLENGEIVYSPTAKIHADLINQGLDPEAVVEGGFITSEGKYVSGSADTPRIMRVAQAKKRLKSGEGTISQNAPKMEGAAEDGIEAYVKGVQKGPNGDVKIWGVKGPPELLKKHFGDEAPGSVPEHVLREKGILPEKVDMSRMNAPNNFARGGTPFNTMFGDKLKAALKEKKDAKPR